MTPTAYQLMVERILEDSFLPRAAMDFTQVNKDLAKAELDNIEAEEECYEVLNRPIVTSYNNTLLGCSTISTVQ